MDEADLHIRNIIFPSVLDIEHNRVADATVIYLISTLLNCQGKALDVISENNSLILYPSCFRYSKFMWLNRLGISRQQKKNYMSLYDVLCAKRILRWNGHLGGRLEHLDDDSRGGKGSLGDKNYDNRFIIIEMEDMTPIWPRLWYSIKLLIR